jgi:hypothetical protein
MSSISDLQSPVPWVLKALSQKVKLLKGGSEYSPLYGDNGRKIAWRFTSIPTDVFTLSGRLFN